jgi:hypothetical protein
LRSSSSSEQCRKQTTLLADGLRLNIDPSRFRVGFWFGHSFGLRLRVDIHVTRTLFVRLMLGLFWWFSQYWIRRRLPLHVPFGGRENLDPAREVIAAFIPDIIGETGPDPVRLVEKDLIPDFEHKEAPSQSGHIHPPDHALGKALPWIGWMEVNPNLIPNRNRRRHHLRHSQML